MNVFEMMAMVKAGQDDELAKVNAMTDAEKEQYVLDQAAKAVEVEKILKELRGDSGFAEFRVV